MSRLKSVLLFVLFLGLSVIAPAQQVHDSVQKDTHRITEGLLLQAQQQQQIDSLVKIQLEGQLKAAVGNRKKTAELENKLNQISVADSIRRIEQNQKILVLKKTAKGYPVMLNQDTLFFVYTRIGSFDARERAASISNRIEKLYTDPFFSADSLLISKNEDSYDLVYKNNNIILSATNMDGLWFGKSNEQLAREYLVKIKQEVIRERKENSLTNWLKRAGLVVLIICFITLIIFLLNKIFKLSARFITNRRSSYLNGLKIGSVRLFTPEHLEIALLKVNNILRVIAIIFVVYLSLPLLFSIFPETEQWTGTLLGWVLSPLRVAFDGILHYLPNLFTVLIIYFIFKYAIRGVRYFFDEVKKDNIRLNGFHPDWAVPTFNILRFVLYAFMLILIFPYLPGSGSPAFQGVSVFLGILLSLGSSSAITNIVAGLVITYMRPFKIGDRVKIGEVTGDVLEKTMLVTRIKTIKNEDITVPNSTVLSSSTINYSTNTKGEGQGLIIHYTLTLGYDNRWEDIYELLIQSALKTEFILHDPKPFVLQTGLDDFYVSYQVNAYTKEANKQAVIYSNLLQQIQDSFNAAGVEILSPNYSVLRTEDMPSGKRDHTH